MRVQDFPVQELYLTILHLRDDHFNLSSSHVDKKGIVQPEGEVMCKNIKDLCPKPTCLEPVLLPDRCCKSCPDTENDFETNFTFRPKGKVTGLYSEDQQHYHKVNEFRALLTGRNVRRHPVRTSSVAIIYMTVERGELRYAVRYSKLDGPKFLQITDVNGKVIFEKPIEKPRHQKGGRKLCGVWQKIPTVYLQYFRQERLFAVITASKYPDGLVAGRIVPNDMTATEIFSSVLSSKTSEGIGGMASFEFDPTTNLLKYVIHVDSLVNAGDEGDYQVLIAKSSRVLHQQSLSVSPLTTKLAGTWKMSKKKERNQLARGRLRVRVVSHNGAAISGIVQPRLTCEAFQAVLSGSNALETHNAVSAGSAIVDLTETGGLEFKVHVVGLKSRVSKIRIEGAVGKAEEESQRANRCQSSRQLLRRQSVLRRLDEWNLQETRRQGHLQPSEQPLVHQCGNTESSGQRTEGSVGTCPLQQPAS
ncbi:chordin-like isoform X2 [Pomacea canaliculata]|uniref:chordin-like isoform X2 n=1 Tax=Pomacea canaliculata TaxID=400727 RepID=UPI000D73BFE5|nr:chordin-like isoform X2 [Pomacea canaliculata]